AADRRPTEIQGYMDSLEKEQGSKELQTGKQRGPVKLEAQINKPARQTMGPALVDHKKPALSYKPNPIQVYTRNGDKRIMDDSGLIRKYVYKPDYGKTPKCEQAMRAKEEEDRLKREAAQKAQEEQEASLEGLKNKWKYKLYLEQEMDHVEEDIRNL
uniref:ENKUR protein n=1 Tax=Denticeps clupeoides TaxID=299321 RepID=A0AAY4CM03_9TELE